MLLLLGVCCRRAQGRVCPRLKSSTEEGRNAHLSATSPPQPRPQLALHRQPPQRNTSSISYMMPVSGRRDGPLMRRPLASAPTRSHPCNQLHPQSHTLYIHSEVKPHSARPGSVRRARGSRWRCTNQLLVIPPRLSKLNKSHEWVQGRHASGFTSVVTLLHNISSNYGKNAQTAIKSCVNSHLATLAPHKWLPHSPHYPFL